MYTVAVGMLETVAHSIRYYRGEITWQEYKYKIGKAWVTAIGAGVSAWAGAATGAGAGTLIGGPIGSLVGGILGGILAVGLAYYGRKGSAKAYEKIFGIDPEVDEQIRRQHMIRDALIVFGYKNAKDIENQEIFNERELRKRYRKLAKKHHPDRNQNPHHH